MTADLLQAIVAATITRVAARRAAVPAASLEARPIVESAPRGFRSALAVPGLQVIAECKRRSPSRGVLREDYVPASIAASYERGGAAAISVLTEPTFFDGDLAHLEAVRTAVSVPVLRKDFIVDEYQLVEARASGADAVLLIVAALEDADMRRLMRSAAALRLDVLVEVHDESELERALDAGATLVGVNNRNLRTLAVDVDASFRLAARLPHNVLAVAESGLRTRADLDRLAQAGYKGFLIGERLMTTPDPGAALAALLGPGSGRVIVKICGITRAEDARLAVSLGASAIGFIFWPSSPRAISPLRARAIVDALPASVTTVGVFVNAGRDEIDAAADEANLQAVQLHGDETPDLARSLSRRVIKAMALTGDIDARVSEWPGTMLLLDAHDPAKRGGTGRVVDWDRAAAIARTRDVILAGGLGPANVADAVTRVRPAGIDVSSGVESSPGIKDPEKLRALFDALAGVEAR